MIVEPIFKTTGPELSIAAFKRVVKERANGWCELRLDGCTGRAECSHHIHRKGQQGSNHPDNGLALCTNCHQHVHANPDESAVNGWLQRSFPRPGDYHFVEAS